MGAGELDVCLPGTSSVKTAVPRVKFSAKIKKNKPADGNGGLSPHMHGCAAGE
jgi:hypothetical protein